MVTGGLLTLDQAAERLAVSPRTLRRWVARGLIPAFRQGRVLRLRALDLDRFIAERMATPTPAGGEPSGGHRLEPGERLWD
jgi:excisionase family DNA binding protein